MATQQEQQQQVPEAAKPDAPIPSEVTQLTRSIAGFTRDLYDQFSKQNPEGNLFFSPLSIATALGMTHAGARGNTAAQMAEALKLNESSDHESFQKLLTGLKTSTAQYTLSTANSLFVDKKFKILEEYMNLVKSSFHAEVKNVNFVEDSESARSTINNWVETETSSKIKDLIPSGMLSPQSVLVLVNAIYFKGNWQSKFSADLTHAKPFQTKNTKREVDMMYQKGKFPIGRLTELDCQILELPYVQNDLSMFVLLPRRPGGLTRLEESLTPAILQSVRSFVTPQTVEVHLPKFKLNEGSELSEILGKLWIKDLFSAGVADLSGIDGTRDLYVSNVVHKAFVEVSEEGTEAAAATAVVVSRRSAMIAQQFNANHPFMFFILHNQTGAILFIGRLCQPEESSKSKDEL